MTETRHQWTRQELAELFYDALLRDPRSENYTANDMHLIAAKAADGVLRG